MVLVALALALAQPPAPPVVIETRTLPAQRAPAPPPVAAPVYYPPVTAATPVAATVPAVPVSATPSALDEVNAVRARVGLPPYLEDPGLTVGAMHAANFRATHLLEGHTGGALGDFAFLPPGTQARAAGCAAWRPEWGWGSCCMFDRYTYGGAAYAVGRDGRRYMHLFVR